MSNVDQIDNSPESPKPRVFKDRIEITLNHLAVRTSDGQVTQYPQADSFRVVDGDLILADADGNDLTLIRSMFWDQILFADATRLREVFRPVYLDAEGNEVPSDD